MGAQANGSSQFDTNSRDPPGEMHNHGRRYESGIPCISKVDNDLGGSSRAIPSLFRHSSLAASYRIQFNPLIILHNHIRFEPDLAGIVVIEVVFICCKASEVVPKRD
jgi:hypothetical protein